MRLEGRTALVTGGAQGIGAAIARRLAAEGASVVIGDIDADKAASVATEISGRAVALDVTDLDSAKGAVEDAGGVEILVNNAGTDRFGFFTETTPEQWDLVLAVNLRGVLNCTYAALTGMQAGGYGRIVNIASEAGRIGSKGSAVYSAAKGGVIAFTKVIAREGARFGINVNGIAPGPIET
ncbi:MAG: SDR family NAD(P)-dependent oxidoreductase, partial [Solirubrobacterales bacterium]